MKRGLAFLVFSVLILSSGVLAQNLRSSKMSVDSQKSIVVYSGTSAFSDGRGVWLEWQTTSETRNLGFTVYRLVGDKKEPVSTNLIGGSYLRAAEMQTAGGYNYFDPNGNGYDTYFIQSLDINGRTEFSEAIYPQFIGDIKTVAGRSALEMTNNALKATPVVQTNKNEVHNIVPDLPMQRWVAGQPGVRIGVKKEGLYRVTRNELQAAGFDVSTTPANWRLFLNGVEQSIIVEPNADYIEFYGYGLDVRETDTQVYFLITGTVAGKRIQTITPPNNPGGFTANYDYSKITKYRSLFISSILNGDEDNYFSGSHIIASTTGTTVNFTLPEFDCDALVNPSDQTLPCNAKVLYLNVRIQGITLTPHSVVVELNGIQIGTLSGSGYQSMELPNLNRKLRVLTPGLVNAGTNTIRLATTGISGDVSLLDSIEVGFRRKFIPQNNQLSFITRNAKKSRINGFTSENVRVFDLLNSDEPSLLDVSAVSDGGASYRVDLPANSPRAIYAVEDTAVSQAAWIVQNTPSALATPAHNAQFIIVTHKNFTTEANAWAAFRAGQGMSTEVVQVDDVYDEFNYGVSSPTALKSFFQYAKDNWQTPPQYILLIGDGTYDYRNYQGGGSNNLIPAKMVDTVYMETGSDETLADFNDDGLAEIAIGRIPARTGADITQAMFKTNAFEQQLANWENKGALFAFDQPVGYDFDALSQRIASNLPPSMQKTFIGRTSSTVPADQDANQLELINSMNTGKYLVNYSGHGSTVGWTSSSRFFSTSNLQVAAPTSPPTQPVVRNVNNFSIYMMLTCLNAYFIQHDNDSLSEKLIKAKWFEETAPQTFNVHEVGAAAVWSSTGKTTPDVQEVMATRFLQQVTLGNMTRFGDLIKDSKTAIIGGRDVRLSWVLLGDPTMKLR